MIACPHITRSTGSHEIGRIVVHFIVVKVMHLQHATFLLLGFTAALAGVVITLANQALEFAGKLRAVGKSRRAFIPISVVRATQVRGHARTRFLCVYFSVERIVWAVPVFRWRAVRDHLLATYEPALHSLRFHFTFQCYPRFNSLLYYSFWCFPVMPMRIGRWFKQSTNGRDQCATSASTWNFRHLINLSITALLIAQAFFCCGQWRIANAIIGRLASQWRGVYAVLVAFDIAGRLQIRVQRRDRRATPTGAWDFWHQGDSFFALFDGAALNILA